MHDHAPRYLADHITYHIWSRLSASSALGRCQTRNKVEQLCRSTYTNQVCPVKNHWVNRNISTIFISVALKQCHDTAGYRNELVRTTVGWMWIGFAIHGKSWFLDGTCSNKRRNGVWTVIILLVQAQSHVIHSRGNFTQIRALSIILCTAWSIIDTRRPDINRLATSNPLAIYTAR